MPLISTLISALFVTIVLIPFLMRKAVALQLVDAPNERKVHSKAVPRVGGIAMIVGMLIPFLIWFPKDRVFAGMLTGVAFLAVFGIWDDRRDINYRIKFAGQALAALAIVVVGDLEIAWVPFVGLPIESGWVTAPLTVFCLLAITNAMNLSDGLDGLAGGTSILSFGLVGLIGYQSQSYSLVLVTLAVAGSLLGFLRFNSHPARIFMGDTGSQFLGFILGVMVILLTQNVNTVISPVVPLLIFGLPVIDTVTVMVKRVMEGRSPFAPDKNHIHHRLLAMGLSHYETVVVLYFIQFGFVALAYFLRFHVDAIVLAAFVGYSMLVLSGIHFALKYDWVKEYDLRFTGIGSMLRIPFQSLLRRSNLSRLIQILLLLVMLVYSIFAFAHADMISVDIGVLASVLAIMTAFNLASISKKQWMDAISMYTACALLAYLGYVQGGQNAIFLMLDWVMIIALGGVVWMAVLFTERKFETSPLDFLVLLLAVLIPLISNQAEGRNLLTLAVIKFIVLLYAFEYLRNGNIVRDLAFIRGGMVASMMVIGCSILL